MPATVPAESGSDLEEAAVGLESPELEAAGLGVVKLEVARQRSGGTHMSGV